MGVDRAILAVKLSVVIFFLNPSLLDYKASFFPFFFTAFFIDTSFGDADIVNVTAASKFEKDKTDNCILGNKVGLEFRLCTGC